jgi:hypothetical protein
MHENRTKEKCKQNRKKEEKEINLQLLLVFSSPVTIVRFFNLLYVRLTTKKRNSFDNVHRRFPYWLTSKGL